MANKDKGGGYVAPQNKGDRGDVAKKSGTANGLPAPRTEGGYVNPSATDEGQRGGGSKIVRPPGARDGYDGTGIQADTSVSGHKGGKGRKVY